jgi:Fe-S oxidoreductase
LCVSCKGCKRDCPTGVDMARIKIEARAAWQTTHGLTLRDRLIAYLPRYAGAAARVEPIVRALDRMPRVSGWIKRRIGVAPQRSLPAITRGFLDSAEVARHRSGGTTLGAGAKEVVLFVDTFNNAIEPDNAKAALRVLEAAGYTVHFNRTEQQRPLCCGRTFLAAGLVNEAKAEARRALDALWPYVERGVPIVGLEPSCLLTLRDEWLGYGFGDEAAKLAESAWLFEEFLVREQAAGRLQLKLQPLGQPRALVHGHCHQKAFDAMSPVQTVLGWIPGLEVSTIESSCCGMAGSFGYEAEHYDTSLAMAELSLLPAVRAARDAGDALVVADGTSCRHQIADGAQTNALHVARVLERALGAD